MGRRVLELFSGLGGWRLALGEPDRVVAAYDIDTGANEVYALNHGERPRSREIASLSAAELASHGADTWALSPPCQPFCRMGRRHGLTDRRSTAFRRLMELFPENPPDNLVLENVEGFLGSDAHALLTERMRAHAMSWRELQLCPSRFGVPNRRPRVYVVASRRPLADREPPDREPAALDRYLDEVEDPQLFLDARLLARHRPGMDLVTSAARRTACFIGGYGQRLSGSGSFLEGPGGVRRFSPAEIARLLGFPDGFHFPGALSLERRYRLLGNSLSLPVARWVVGLLDG